MVVSLLSITAPASQRPSAEHHFAYPSVRPLPRPVGTRRDDARTW